LSDKSIDSSVEVDNFSNKGVMLAIELLDKVSDTKFDSGNTSASAEILLI
jgi:hypothetical protein